MLHQDNRGMQKPGRASWSGNPEEFASFVEEPDPHAEAGPSGKIILAKLTPLTGVDPPFVGQDRRRQLHEKGPHRHEPLEGAVRIALGVLEANRFLERERAAW